MRIEKGHTNIITKTFVEIIKYSKIIVNCPETYFNLRLRTLVDLLYFLIRASESEVQTGLGEVGHLITERLRVRVWQ